MNYNPDVLSCLANLSNDEVFTPPAVVNQMLDLLPQELFASPKTKFLDPATKSGVFLREITKRLIKGLENEIPDLRTRVDHILQNQIFGIATTELTSLVARRSLYCSKYPNCKYSVSKFDTVEGEHPLPFVEAHIRQRTLQMVRRKRFAVRPRRIARIPRLRVHPHIQPRGDFQHEVRRHHQQPAVSDGRRRELGKCHSDISEVC